MDEQKKEALGEGILIPPSYSISAERRKMQEDLDKLIKDMNKPVITELDTPPKFISWERPIK